MSQARLNELVTRAGARHIFTGWNAFSSINFTDAAQVLVDWRSLKVLPNYDRFTFKIVVENVVFDAANVELGVMPLDPVGGWVVSGPSLDSTRRFTDGGATPSNGKSTSTSTVFLPQGNQSDAAVTGGGLSMVLNVVNATDGIRETRVFARGGFYMEGPDGVWAVNSGCTEQAPTEMGGLSFTPSGAQVALMSGRIHAFWREEK